MVRDVQPSTASDCLSEEWLEQQQLITETNVLILMSMQWWLDFGTVSNRREIYQSFFRNLCMWLSLKLLSAVMAWISYATYPSY